MDTDGNVRALERYEREQEKSEKAYEYFIEAVLESEVVNLYEDSRAEFNRLCENYGFENYGYEEFVKDHI